MHEPSRLREGRNLAQHLPFANVATTTVFREMTEANAHFTGKTQSSMFKALELRSRHLSALALFVPKVAKRKRN